MSKKIFLSFLSIILVISICSMLVLHLLLLLHQSDNKFIERVHNLPHYADTIDLYGDTLLMEDHDLNDYSNKKSNEEQKISTKSYVEKDCTMGNCFNYESCKESFKVYVYPDIPGDHHSQTFQAILNIIRSSVYYTSSPKEACIFIPSLDTLDRDILSINFRKELSTMISSLEYWNSTGRNHILFNLYAGTSPDYHEEEYHFKVSESILAKASFSTRNFRTNFDISLPLMHKGYPVHSSRPKTIDNMLNRVNKKYALAFKGKRYLIGIGSRSRNALFHLHNHKDIILLTTCRHNNDWMKYMDDRCLIDNRLYDQYDYKELIKNATFCLVPRGRRLGSYRFIEVLRAGCIPVILSNDYEPPFSEVIDWRKAVIWVDERLLFQVSWIVRSVSEERIIAYRQQVKFLYDTYFSSLDKILNTVFEIIKDRLSIRSRDKSIWNTFPGALALQAGYSSYICDFPVSSEYCRKADEDGVTVIIYAAKFMPCSATVILQTISEIKSTNMVKRIIIIWQASTETLLQLQKLLSQHSFPMNFVNIIEEESQSPNSRFSYLNEISTRAVISINCHIPVSKIHIKQLYRSWMNFPDRIIGYAGKNHNWDPKDTEWQLLSQTKKEYSMAMLDLAIYHRYYQWSYWNVLSSRSRHMVKKYSATQCDSILFNILVAHTVHKPPLIIQHTSNTNLDKYSQDFNQNDQSCLTEFVSLMGYLPLEKTSIYLN